MESKDINKKIPPGFKDSGKSSDSDNFSEQCRKYGDLIVWKQIIDKAIDTKTPIILVTDDKKEDWWQKFKGKTIGPRPELVLEFKKETNYSFYMYQADRFLELARNNLNESVSEDSVNEIREVRERDRLTKQRQESNGHLEQRKSKINELTVALRDREQQLAVLAAEEDALQERIHYLDHERHNAFEYLNSSAEDSGNSIDPLKMRHHYMMTSEAHEQLKKDIDRLRQNRHELEYENSELSSKLAREKLRLQLMEQVARIEGINQFEVEF